MFGTGMVVNIQSDNLLMALRKQSGKQSEKKSGEKKYFIPRGGMFDYVRYRAPELWEPASILDIPMSTSLTIYIYRIYCYLYIISIVVHLDYLELSSCANYFGEILEWTGFAIACGGMAPLSFWIWTCANLIPRAIATHKWYHNKFGSSYPKSRKAIIPFIW